jgi:hypothetical protein
MLGGGNQHALPHEASGIADAGNVAPTGGDVKIVEIGTEEDDSGGGGGGKYSNGNRDSTVKSDSLGLYWPLDRGLKPQCGFLWVVRVARFARFKSNWKFHFTKE